MIHSHLAKQKNHYAASFTLLQFSTQSFSKPLISTHFTLPLTGRLKISWSVFWCLRFMQLLVPSYGTISWAVKVHHFDCGGAGCWWPHAILLPKRTQPALSSVNYFSRRIDL